MRKFLDSFSKGHVGKKEKDGNGSENLAIKDAKFSSQKGSKNEYNAAMNPDIVAYLDDNTSSDSDNEAKEVKRVPSVKSKLASKTEPIMLDGADKNEHEDEDFDPEFITIEKQRIFTL